MDGWMVSFPHNNPGVRWVIVIDPFLLGRGPSFRGPVAAELLCGGGGAKH